MARDGAKREGEAQTAAEPKMLDSKAKQFYRGLFASAKIDGQGVSLTVIAAVREVLGRTPPLVTLEELNVTPKELNAFEREAVRDEIELWAKKALAGSFSTSEEVLEWVRGQMTKWRFSPQDVSLTQQEYKDIFPVITGKKPDEKQ